MTEDEWGGIRFCGGGFVSKDGARIATAFGGNVKYEPGMAGYYKKFVEAYMKANPDLFAAVPPGATLPGGDIPETALPEFDRRLGVETPGFREWCTRQQLSDEQIAEVIRRLERTR